jgi:hypothetical protein
MKSLPNQTHNFLIYFSNVRPSLHGGKTRHNLNVAGGFPKEFSEALAGFLKEGFSGSKPASAEGF